MANKSKRNLLPQIQMLVESGMSLPTAARFSGTHPNTVYRWYKELGLTPPRNYSPRRIKTFSHECAYCHRLFEAKQLVRKFCTRKCMGLYQAANKSTNR